MSLNHIVIMGNMVRDPELRYTQNGTAVCNFTLAVDRKFKDKETGERGADFIRCIAFGSTAEFVCKHFTKGRKAVAEGHLQVRDWTDKDGNKRTSTEVVAESVYFADSNRPETAPLSQDDQMPYVDSDLPFLP